MDNNVKIALVQFQSKLNCPDENVEKACGMIAQAASQGLRSFVSRSFSAPVTTWISWDRGFRRTPSDWTAPASLSSVRLPRRTAVM